MKETGGLIGLTTGHEPAGLPGALPKSLTALPSGLPGALPESLPPLPAGLPGGLPSPPLPVGLPGGLLDPLRPDRLPEDTHTDPPLPADTYRPSTICRHFTISRHIQTHRDNNYLQTHRDIVEAV